MARRLVARFDRLLLPTFTAWAVTFDSHYSRGVSANHRRSICLIEAVWVVRVLLESIVSASRCIQTEARLLSSIVELRAIFLKIRGPATPFVDMYLHISTDRYTHTNLPQHCCGQEHRHQSSTLAIASRRKEAQ